MKIVITQEDVKNSTGFSDIFDCPLANVMKKVLNLDKISVGTNSIGKPDKYGNYAKISPPFLEEDYTALLNGEIKEFVTEYTPL